MKFACFGQLDHAPGLRGLTRYSMLGLLSGGCTPLPPSADNNFFCWVTPRSGSSSSSRSQRDAASGIRFCFKSKKKGKAWYRFSVLYSLLLSQTRVPVLHPFSVELGNETNEGGGSGGTMTVL